MASRLYPGFGSGKGAFEGHFDVRSFKSAGHTELEAGDKVILPQSVLKDITRLKLPFPLLFKVANDRLKTANTVPAKDGKMPDPASPEQYAGLYEFSAPEGTALIPSWMMTNLKLREGSKVSFTSTRGLPQASYAKFRPHQQAFIDLAAEIGPRDLLEAAMRNYSALSAGERIIVDVADQCYALDVVEVRPGTACTLYGNLDLEVDFAPMKGSPEDLAYHAAVAEERAVLADAARTKAGAAAEGKAAEGKPVPGAKAGAVIAKAGVKQPVAKAAAASRESKDGKERERGVGPLSMKGTAAGVHAVSAKRVGSAAGGGAAAVRAMVASASSVTAPPTAPAKTAGTPAKAGASTPTAAAQLAGKAVVAAAGAPALATPVKGVSSKQGVQYSGPGGILTPHGGVLSPLARGGGAGLYVGGAGAIDWNAPMIPLEDLPLIADPGAAAVSSISLPLLSSVLRTPPRAGLAVEAAGAVAEDGFAAFVGEGHRLGSPVKGKAVASPRAAASEAAMAGAMSSPSKAAVRAAAAVATAAAATALEDARKQRELRAKAAMARFAAPAPAEQAQATPTAGAGTPSKQGLAEVSVCSPRAAPSDETAAQAKVAREAEEHALHGAAVNSDGTRTCPFCVSDITPAAFDLHVLRCRRNTAYHKGTCGTCSARVLNKDMARHVHCSLGCGGLVPFPDSSTPLEAAVSAHAAACPQRTVTCECGAKCAACDLDVHRDSCPSALETCRYCRVKHKRSAIGAHQDKCGSRTAACERCGKQVVLKLLEAHAMPGGACDQVLAAKAEKAAAAAAAIKAKEDAVAAAAALAKAAAGPTDSKLDESIGVCGPNDNSKEDEGKSS